MQRDLPAEARARARAAALPGSWLEMVLDHHLAIEAAFTRVANAATAEDRRWAQQALATVLTGHAIAEESVIYPALALGGERGQAEMAYREQSAAKVQMAELEALDPMSREYVDMLEHIRGAVAHHVYEEEGSRFLELRAKASSFTQRRLAARYHEEFHRYYGNPHSQYAVRAIPQMTTRAAGL